MRLRVKPAVVAAAASLALASLPVAPARAAVDPWQRDASWITLRLGAVKKAGENAPDGNVGGGLHYRRMLTSRLAVNGGFDYDLVGRYAGSALIEVPVSLELALHFHWKTPVHPAVGMGFAGVYSKAYRSGDDYTEFQPAGFGSIALHAPIDHNTVAGVEFRAMSVSSDQPRGNPVFETGSPSSGRLSLKVSVSRVF